MNAPVATYKVIYSSKDITKDISEHLLSLTYTDKVEGEPDELTISLEDVDGNWQNAWYPKTGDIISAEIEMQGVVLQCGSFTVDEKELSISRSGDVFSISAVSAYVTKKMRTKRGSAHENKTLGEIARTVAARHSLTVQGTIANFRIGRVTQHRESDLAFLQRIANEYGYTFSVRGNKMIFTSYDSIEGRGVVMSIDKSDLISGAIKDKAATTYKSARVRYHDPSENETIEGESTDDTTDTSADTLEIQSKAENTQQAETKAAAALHKANTIQQKGSITIPGSPLIVSGVNYEQTGIGQLSGIYHVIESVHSLSRSTGYETKAEVKRVGHVPAAKFIAKQAKKITPIRIVTINNADNIPFTFVNP
jgi:phage protein D